MAAQEVVSAGTVPPQSNPQPTADLSLRPSPQLTSAVSSPTSDNSEKFEWHVCPHCKTARRANSKKTLEKPSTSSSTSPTTSDISQARSTSFARLGHKIKDVFSLGLDSSAPPPEKLEKPEKSEKPNAVKKKPQKKKPKKPKVVPFENGYEELGGDHWADDY